MRILITSFTFPPQTNGVAEVAGAHAVGLAQRGHEVTVLTSVDSARHQAGPSQNPLVLEFDLGRPGADRAGHTEAKRYQDCIRSYPADVVLCHSYRMWHTSLAVPVIAENPAKKVLVSHGFPSRRWQRNRRFPWGLGGWVRVRFATWEWLRTARAFDYIVFLSQRVDRDRFFDHWLTQRLGRPPCSVIPNGTSPDTMLQRTTDFRQQYGIGDQFMALYVARYDESKNQAAALRAFFRAKIENSILVFIGTEFNEYSHRLQRLEQTVAPSGQRSRVFYLQRLPKEMIRAAYRAADVFVMPSKAEVQPLVVLDAMACGKPFVATNVGCVAELPGGVVVRHERQMAYVIRKLRADPAWRAELGSAGREACERNYNWPTVLSTYEALFAKIVSTQGRVCCGSGANRE